MLSTCDLRAAGVRAGSCSTVALAVLVALLVGATGHASSLRTVEKPGHATDREASRVHLQPPLQWNYTPEWTQLELEGGTITAIARRPDGSLWAGGLYAPIDPSGVQAPFLVTSDDLGAAWSPRVIDDLVVTVFSRTSVAPATASNGSLLLLTDERVFLLEDETGEWVTLHRPEGSGMRPMVTFDVGRGSPSTALLGLGGIVAGTFPFSPELIAFDIVQGTSSLVTPPQAADMRPVAVAISDLDGNTWAAAFETPAGGGLLVRSENAGQTWTTLPLPGSGRISALTWQADRLLVAQERSGILAFRDGTWERIDDGDTRLRQVRALAVSPHDPGLIFAAGRQGLSRSVDGGARWTHALEGTEGFEVKTIYPDPTDPGLVFIGTVGEAIVASVDGGVSFFSASAGIAAASVLDVTSSPANPRQLAVVQGREQRALIRESFDAGASWSRPLAAPAEPAALSFGYDGSLWMLGKRAGDPLDMRLYRRDGARWQRMNLPMPAPGSVQLEFLEHGEAHGTLYTGGGVTSGALDGTGLAWRSLDHGRSWQLLWEEPPSDDRLYSARALVEMPGFDGRELIIDQWERVDEISIPILRRSSDAGATWSLFSTSNGLNQRFLCADPGQPGRLITIGSLFFGGMGELLLDVGPPGRSLVGQIAFPPTAFECWFGEDGMRYVAGSDRQTSVVIGQEGSNARPAPAIGEWPLRQTFALHRWDGGLLLGSGSGLWFAPPEEAAPAPVLVSATDAGARMTISARLSWTGGAPWVRVLRDGDEVAWIQNTGEWSARFLRQSNAPSEYTVCNGFDDNCSESMVLMR